MIPLLFAAVAFPLPSSAAKTRVAMLDLTARGVDETTTAVIGDLVAGEITKSGEFDLISGADAKNILNLERSKQVLGCSGDNCFSELGGLLNVTRLVAGSVTKLGEIYLIALQLIDAKRGQVLSRATFQSSSRREDLIVATGNSVRGLLAIPARLQIFPQVEGGRVLIDDQLVATMPTDIVPVQVSGPATLRVEHFNYIPWESRIDLTPGRVTRIKWDGVTPEELESRAARKKILGGGLGVLSAGAIVTAVVLFKQSRDMQTQYQAADPRRTSQATFDDMVLGIQLRSTGGFAALGAGAAGLGGALWLLLSGGGEEAAPAPSSPVRPEQKKDTVPAPVLVEARPKPPAPQEHSVVTEPPAPAKKDEPAVSEAAKGEPMKKPPVRKKTK